MRDLRADERGVCLLVAGIVRCQQNRIINIMAYSQREGGISLESQRHMRHLGHSKTLTIFQIIEIKKAENPTLECRLHGFPNAKLRACDRASVFRVSNNMTDMTVQ